MSLWYDDYKPRLVTLAALNVFKISKLSICHPCDKFNQDCSFIHKTTAFEKAKSKKDREKEQLSYVLRCAGHKYKKD